MTLPPLPVPKTLSLGDEDGSICLGYTPAQMREYGELCRQQALEEAAQKCDQLWQDDGTAYECREAIRSLIK